MQFRVVYITHHLSIHVHFPSSSSHHNFTRVQYNKVKFRNFLSISDPHSHIVPYWSVKHCLQVQFPFPFPVFRFNPCALTNLSISNPLLYYSFLSFPIHCFHLFIPFPYFAFSISLLNFPIASSNFHLVDSVNHIPISHYRAKPVYQSLRQFHVP